jgi:hypothetical protein
MATMNPSAVAPVNQWEDDGGAIPSIAAVRNQSCPRNVGNAERVISGIAGGALLMHGLMSRSILGFATTLVGGGLLYRGLSGHCHLYQALDVSTASDSLMAGCCEDEAACSAQPSARSANSGRPRELPEQKWQTASPEDSSDLMPTHPMPINPVASSPMPADPADPATSNPMPGSSHPTHGPVRKPDRSYEGTPGSPPPGRT